MVVEIQRIFLASFPNGPFHLRSVCRILALNVICPKLHYAVELHRNEYKCRLGRIQIHSIQDHGLPLLMHIPFHGGVLKNRNVVYRLDALADDLLLLVLLDPLMLEVEQMF